MTANDLLNKLNDVNLESFGEVGDILRKQAADYLKDARTAQRRESTARIVLAIRWSEAKEKLGGKLTAQQRSALGKLVGWGDSSVENVVRLGDVVRQRGGWTVDKVPAWAKSAGNSSAWQNRCSAEWGLDTDEGWDTFVTSKGTSLPVKPRKATTPGGGETTKAEPKAATNADPGESTSDSTPLTDRLAVEAFFDRMDPAERTKAIHNLVRRYMPGAKLVVPKVSTES